MRSSASKLILLLLLFGATAAELHADPRARFTINDDWQFIGSDLPMADGADWQKVTLPHTWNIADTLDDEPGYRRGVGWYRRQLDLGPEHSKKRIFLYFEGVNQTAEVFVNEKLAGRHIGGYTAFVFDVTELVQFGRPNALAVKVDNSRNLDIPPIDGDFNMHGGIYRDVWIVAANDAHIKIDDMASPGIVVRTPLLSGNSAAVDVSGTVVNAASKARRFEAVTTIFDKNGRRVTTKKKAVNVAGRGETQFKNVTLRVMRPKLWSPDEPYLYTIKTVIRENGKELDSVTQPLGLRSFRFDPAEGFFLNGKPLKLRGTNRHQDYKGLGNAVPNEIQVRDLEIIKETGFNFVRLAHYPQDPSVLEAADRLGLMIWEEIPVVNQIHVSEGFNANAARMLREMIRQHRNHPSVIIWGFMNEVFLPVPKTDEHVKATVELARMLEKICKEEDPSRPTAIAFDHGARELYNSSGLGDVTQIVGWNLYHGWYYETFEDLGKFLDDQHRRFPKRVLMVSEYGANADRRVHSLRPRRFDSTVEWQRMYHEAYLPQIVERKYLAGSAVWNNFDFSSEFRGETIPHINQKGLFTYGREPKDIAFFYKANFVGSPVLHIAVRDRPKRSGSSEQPVDIYTNLDEVELFQNGVPIGKKSGGPSRKLVWNVKFRPGSNSLAARGTYRGAAITDEAEVVWSDPADRTNIGVNAGSNAEYFDGAGAIWQADRPYATGGWGYIGDGSKETSNLRNILGTDEDAVAQTAREGAHGYKFDVPAGEYEVELWFAELKNAVKPGERVFDVLINDAIVLREFDPAKEAGLFRLAARKINADARNNAGLRVDLRPVKGQPIISGLRIRRVN